MRAESLQRRPPRSLKAFIAARTIARVAKIFFVDAPCDDPRPPLFPAEAVLVRPVATVLDGEHFVAAGSSGPSQNVAIAVGFSIATTLSPSADNPRCSSAPSDALVEICFRTPSINTLGFAVAVIADSSLARCAGVAFSAELTDLD
jgi:hypothetical protein